MGEVKLERCEICGYPKSQCTCLEQETLKEDKETEDLKKIAGIYRQSYPRVREYYDQQKQLFINEDEDNPDRKAFSITYNYFHKLNASIKGESFKINREQRKQAIPIEGFLIGFEPLRDKAQEIRNRAKKYVENYGEEAAINAGIINASKETLDDREKVFGRDNTKYQQPLPANLKLYEKTLYGVFRRDDFEEFKFSKLSTSNNSLSLAWDKLEFPKRAFISCTSYGLDRESESMFTFYGSINEESRRTLFKPVTKDWNIENILRKAMSSFTIKIGELYEKYKELKDFWDRIVCLEGLIVDIKPAWSNIWRGTPAILLDVNDLGSNCKVNIPFNWKTNFGEGSRVIVYGKPNIVRERDGEGGYREINEAQLDCFGVYALPKLTMNTAPIEDSRDTIVDLDGWIENDESQGSD